MQHVHQLLRHEDGVQNPMKVGEGLRCWIPWSPPYSPLCSQGILSPLILAFLQYRFIWRVQKLQEMKKEVFDEAIKTLAMNEVAQLFRPRVGTRGYGAAAAEGRDIGRDFFQPR